jgi:hypothetical protein
VVGGVSGCGANVIVFPLATPGPETMFHPFAD